MSPKKVFAIIANVLGFNCFQRSNRETGYKTNNKTKEEEEEERVEEEEGEKKKKKKKKTP